MSASIEIKTGQSPDGQEVRELVVPFLGGNMCGGYASLDLNGMPASCLVIQRLSSPVPIGSDWVEMGSEPEGDRLVLAFTKPESIGMLIEWLSVIQSRMLRSIHSNTPSPAESKSKRKPSRSKANKVRRSK